MKDFKQYCKSYSGIDGGDINAKYWFVGIEWSNHNDTEYRNKEWNPPTNITGITIEDSDDWNFEKRLEKNISEFRWSKRQKNIFRKFKFSET